MPTYEGFRLKLLKFWRLSLADYRKTKLKYTDFTIISNNCWGGMIYESYNLPKNTPTVGLFFMPTDYLKFLNNLEDYLSEELEFIKPENSKWKQEISMDKRFGDYPVGRLRDIEIFFLHYHNEQEAKEKWERRVQRINWDKLLIKFNDQNGCTQEDILNYMNLPYRNKIFFTCKEWQRLPKESVIIHQPFRHNFVRASYEPFGHSRYIDITSLINSL